MARYAKLFFACLFVVCATLVGSAGAQEVDKKAGAGQEDLPKVIHRLNSNGVDYFVKGKNNVEQPESNATVFSAPTGGTRAVGPLLYHGGNLIGTPTAYIVWYGNWNQSNGSDTPAGQQIVRDFLTHLGGSPYFSLNSTLSTSSHNISGNVFLGGEATDTGSQGTSLSDSKVLAAITNAITGGKLPYDANGVYFLLSSTNISETSGFCTQYCGFHSVSQTSVGNLRWSFVGNANRCLNGCAAQSISPNGNAGVDGMVSIISHELSESTTDPDLNAWFTRRGSENGDLCNFTFGHFQFTTANGSFANITLGTRNFLIQRIIKHSSSGDFCMMDSGHN